MGVGFIPLNMKNDREYEEFRGDLNINGWSSVLRILERLGCDTSSANKDRVPAKITKQWGAALAKALEENLVKENRSGNWAVVKTGKALEKYDLLCLQEIAHFFKNCGGCILC